MRSAPAIDSTESKTAVQWYMDLFKNGLGTVAPAGDWCGGMLGKGQVAIAFEGGWLKGAMDAFPDVKWKFVEMPVGSSGEKVTIPEKLVPHFKPGKALRESVDDRLPVRDDEPIGG